VHWKKRGEGVGDDGKSEAQEELPPSKSTGDNTSCVGRKGKEAKLIIKRTCHWGDGSRVSNGTKLKRRRKGERTCGPEKGRNPIM